MLKPVVRLLAVVMLLVLAGVLILFYSANRRGTSLVFAVPHNFEGYFVVLEPVECDRSLPAANTEAVIEIPTNGICVSTDYGVFQGWRRRTLRRGETTYPSSFPDDSLEPDEIIFRSIGSSRPESGKFTEYWFYFGPAAHFGNDRTRMRVESKVDALQRKP